MYSAYQVNFAGIVERDSGQSGCWRVKAAVKLSSGTALWVATGRCMMNKHQDQSESGNFDHGQYIMIVLWMKC